MFLPSYTHIAREAANSLHRNGRKGHLVVIDSAEENAFVTQLVHSTIRGHDINNNGNADADHANEEVLVWIGADDKQIDGRWNWNAYGSSNPVLFYVADESKFSQDDIHKSVRYVHVYAYMKVHTCLYECVPTYFGSGRRNAKKTSFSHICADAYTQKYL